MTGRPRLRTRFRLVDRTLLIDLGAVRPVLSSAPRGGGLTRARFILNHQVPANPIGRSPRRRECAWKDPSRYLGRVAAAAGADGPTVGLMTAVPLAKLVTIRRAAGDLWVEGLITVGVTNAVRAGEPPRSSPHVRAAGPGTINVILLTNARLAASAMVCAVQVATEAKAAVLLAAGVRSWTGRPGATGTGTDAVVVVSGDGPSHRYSGTHTALGALIGRVVADGVRAGLAKWRAARAARR